MDRQQRLLRLVVRAATFSASAAHLCTQSHGWILGLIICSRESSTTVSHTNIHYSPVPCLSFAVDMASRLLADYFKSILFKGWRPDRELFGNPLKNQALLYSAAPFLSPPEPK